MVYHIPGQEPLGNSVWLGPLRVFTCDEGSALLPQRLFKFLSRYIIYAFGVGKLLEMLDGKLPVTEALRFVKSVLREEIPLARRVVILYLLGAGIAFFKYLFDKWWNHMYYIPPRSARYFWETDEEGNAPEGAYGVLFYSKPKNLPPNATPADVKTVMINKKWNRWYTWPITSQDQGLVRGMNYTGMKLLPFFYTELTTGFEYPMTSLCRVIQRYCWVPKWNKPKADRRKMYLAVMNTSYACFIDYNPHSENFGHVVSDDIILPYAQTSIKAFSRMIIYLDHEREVVTKVRLFSQDNDKVPTVETYGSEIDSENTYNMNAEISKDGITINQFQNLEQAAMLMIVVISLYNHGLVHYWSNGTACLPDGVWSQRDASTNITNWMNSQAIFLTWLFFGSTMATMETICVRNVMQGLPHHGTYAEVSADVPASERDSGLAKRINLMKLVASRSKFHQMSSRARVQLSEFFNVNPNQSPNIPEIDAIVSATVMHSAEHYYAWQYLPLFGTNGSMMALKSDMSGMTQCLIAPIAYKTRSYLCRQHLKDPVCRIVYDISYNIDSDFADNALSIGCAF